MTGAGVIEKKPRILPDTGLCLCCFQDLPFQKDPARDPGAEYVGRALGA